jgi:hypothetical protein
MGKPTLKRMHELRKDLHGRLMNLAVTKLNLPAEPESHFIVVGGKEKGRVRVHGRVVQDTSRSRGGGNGIGMRR